MSPWTPESYTPLGLEGFWLMAGFVVAMLAVWAWHLRQEKVRPGGNAQDINELIYWWAYTVPRPEYGAESSWEPKREWHPVTRWHDKWVHGYGIFGGLLSLIVGGVWWPACWDLAAGIMLADFVQHVAVFRRRVSGYGSAWGYGLIAAAWFAYRWNQTGLELDFRMLAGFALVFGNLALLVWRARR